MSTPKWSIIESKCKKRINSIGGEIAILHRPNVDKTEMFSRERNAIQYNKESINRHCASNNKEKWCAHIALAYIYYGTDAHANR